MTAKPKYQHQNIEPKWQKYWDENRTFKAEVNSSKPKYYVLDMFPFPSGAGLHVGHVEGYTATDILARYKRQRGFSVLHPMGWDSFGLPAEQYAVRTGTHPSISTQKNIANFKKQLKLLGFSYDWDREINTSSPDYYKWTQWIFTKLYEKGLAYEAEVAVNYCPELGTVLANEEVEDGKSKVGGYPVVRKPLRQWVLKITAYAERLIQDLDLIDWPENLKKLQSNWIGKSEGAQVEFKEKSTGESIHVFTTRPDTLFGATFMVLAPEHPLVDRITTSQYKAEVDSYKKEAASKSELARTELNKNKTGVFTGAYVINPVNNQEMPIWISDYVLISYGTGAIMAVPTHDERDFAFATKYKLPVVAVFDPDFKRHPELVEGESNLEEVRNDILSGKRCWTGDGICINSVYGDLNLNDLDVASAKKTIITWLEKKGKGKLTIQYKLRDWLFSRQRYWGEPFPILHFQDGSKRALELDELPLPLPDVKDFKPSKDGKSPLTQAKDWLEITDSKTGKLAWRETNTMPNWAGSSWYYLRFCDPHNEKEAWSSDSEKYWLPVDMYIGGVEHAVLHLLYARFWHKVLFDCGFVSTPEPFKVLRNQGIIVARSYINENNQYVAPEDVVEKNGVYFHKKTGEVLKSQVEKMSKSKLNGVSPDEIIEEFGADSLRLYEMFMGPLEKEKIWNTDAVNGCKRFLNRFFDLVVSDKVVDAIDLSLDEEALKLGYRLVHGVTGDVESLLFNTAIAKMMEFLNDFSKLPRYPKKVLKMAVQALSPFAPHIAEEMWEYLGFKESLSFCPYPEIEEKYLVDELITYVVQINGKLRGKFDLPKDQPEAVILAAAKKQPLVQKYLDGMTVNKVVFVPNKLLNLVVS